jgi:hypothetical protein
MNIDYQKSEIESFMSRNEPTVMAWTIGVVLGTGFGYMLFLMVKALLSLGK